MKKIRKKISNCKTLAKISGFFSKHLHKNKPSKNKEN